MINRTPMTVFRDAALLFMLLCSVYALTMSGRLYSMDGMAMYEQSKTLLFQHTLRFSPPFVCGDYRANYTPWPEGLSILYLCPLAVLSYVVFPKNLAFRVVPQGATTLVLDPSFVYMSVTNVVITALTASILFILAIKFGLPRTRAMLLTLVWGLASPAFAYQKQDFAQPLAALLITATILLYAMAYTSDRPWRKSLCLSVAGALLGFLLMTRSETVVIVVPAFLLFSLARLRHAGARERIAAGLALLVPLSLLAALHAGINYIKCGSPFGVQASRFATSIGMHGFCTAFLGLLASPGRGLLVFFPLAAYAPLGLYRMYRGPHKQWGAMFFWLIVLPFGLFALWPVWWGGVSWGPRFLVPILPILTLLAFWPAADHREPAAVRRYAMGAPKVFVVMAGCMMTLSGVLLRWDAIERERYPGGAESGRWCFSLRSNGLWTNWRDLGHPARYDGLLFRPSFRGAQK